MVGWHCWVAADRRVGGCEWAGGGQLVGLELADCRLGGTVGQRVDGLALSGWSLRAAVCTLRLRVG